ARQPEPADVEQIPLRLVRDLQVDVLEHGDVAQILSFAIVMLRHVHLRSSLSLRGARRRSNLVGQREAGTRLLRCARNDGHYKVTTCSVARGASGTRFSG